MRAKFVVSQNQKRNALNNLSQPFKVTFENTLFHSHPVVLKMNVLKTETYHKRNVTSCYCPIRRWLSFSLAMPVTTYKYFVPLSSVSIEDKCIENRNI